MVSFFRGSLLAVIRVLRPKHSDLWLRYFHDLNPNPNPTPNPTPNPKDSKPRLFFSYSQ